MFLLFLPLSFVIPSSSGLATLAMPIMAPLAGFLGVSTALVVTSYQSASGVMNLVVPTSAVVMGGLAIARVPYGTYLRWVWPLLALLSGAGDHRARDIGGVLNAERIKMRRGVELLLIVSRRCSPARADRRTPAAPKHHRGDEIGSHGTKVVVVHIVP